MQGPGYYGTTSCGVSYCGIQNPIFFCLKLRCSNGLFNIFWNEMMAGLQNLVQFLQNKLFLNMTCIKSTNNKNCTSTEKKNIL